MDKDKPLSSSARAMKLALDRVDGFKVGSNSPRLADEVKVAVEKVLERKNKSDRAALLFLTSYKVIEPKHDASKVPAWRPVDKHLCAALTERNLALHGNITSYAENMGIKGQAKSFNLFARPYLGPALKLIESKKVADKALNFIAWKFAQSFKEPLPPLALGDEYLTFVRSEIVCHELLAIPSQGHIQQLLLAALLKAFHEPNGLRVLTHHPHGSDKSDEAAGDVEVFDENDVLVEAYEITVRPDWKNRKPDLATKARDSQSASYVLVCERSDDEEIESPDALEKFMADVGGDIAVIDILAFVSVLLVQLSSDQRKATFDFLQEYLRDPDLCGVPEHIEVVGALLRARLGTIGD